MKAFFKDYSYYSLKMFLYQFGIALFGMAVTLPFANRDGSDSVGQLIAGICAVIFYLFLIYYMTWEIGSDDKYGIDHGLKRNMPLRGLYMSLIANIPNILLAVLNLLGVKFCNIISLMLNGMYLGIMATDYKPNTPLNTAWWMYFIIIIPSLLISTLSYYLGTKQIYFTPLFDSKNPESKKKEKNN